MKDLNNGIGVLQGILERGCSLTEREQKVLSFAIKLYEELEKVEGAKLSNEQLLKIGILVEERHKDIKFINNDIKRSWYKDLMIKLGEKIYNACLHQVKLILLKAGLVVKPKVGEMKEMLLEGGINRSTRTVKDVAQSIVNRL